MAFYVSTAFSDSLAIHVGLVVEYYIISIYRKESHKEPLKMQSLFLPSYAGCIETTTRVEWLINDKMQLRLDNIEQAVDPVILQRGETIFPLGVRDGMLPTIYK